MSGKPNVAVCSGMSLADWYKKGGGGANNFIWIAKIDLVWGK